MKKRFQQVMSMLMCVAMLLSGMTTGVMDALAEEWTDGTAQTQEVQQGDSGNTPEAQPAAPASDAPKNEQPAAPAGDAPKTEQPAAPAGDAPKTEQPTNEGEGEQAAPKGDDEQNTEADEEQEKDQESVSENDGEEKNEESAPTDGDEQEAEPAAGNVSVAAQNGQPAASADCAHANKTVTGTDEEATSDWKPIDRRNHKRTVDVYQTWTCADCQATGRDLLESGKTEIDYHRMNEGVCNECGYECPHGDVNTHVYTSSIEGEKAEPVDKATHKGIVDKHSFWQCFWCGWVKDTVIESGVEEITNHQFVEGVCKVCGYECKHENVTSHTYMNLHAGEKGEPVDEKTHKGLMDELEFWQCNDCYWAKNTVLRENVESVANHGWMGGKCDFCGYVCPHTETRSSTGDVLAYGESWHSIDEKTHKGIVNEYTSTMCVNCSDYHQELTQENVEKTFNHDFENGVCRSCGYECQHTQKNSWENIVLADGESWTQVDEKTHKGIVDIHRIERCTNCNASTDTVTQSRVEKTVEHWFREGTCRNCGYVCPHDQLDSWNDYELCEGQTWQSVNDDSHKAVVNITKRIYCTNCSKHFDEPGEQNTEQTLRHSYTEESECRDCGHVCSHEGAEVYDPECQLCEGESWQSIDEKNHQGIVDVYQPAFCLHCYRRRRRCWNPM